MSNEFVLKPVDSQIYKLSDNREPQYVTFQYPNQGEIFCDSQTSINNQSPVNVVLSTRKTPNDRTGTLFTNCSRLAVQSVGLRYVSPNVNARNNTIRFFSSASVSFHTVDLIEGFYTTADLLIDHIVTRLNTLTGASGLTFSRIALAGFAGSYTLNSAGGNYYFDLDCSAIVKGYQLYNLPKDQVANNSKIVGYMGLVYTRYIDFTSKVLTKYAKIPSKTTGYSSNLLERLFVPDSTKPNIISSFGIGSSIFNYKPSDSVHDVDIRLLDQFGDDLYVKEWNGTYGGFYFDINFTVF